LKLAVCGVQERAGAGRTSRIYHVRMDFLLEKTTELMKILLCIFFLYFLSFSKNRDRPEPGRDDEKDEPLWLSHTGSRGRMAPQISM